MSEGSYWPKTWSEAVPLIVWGTLVFAAGFEFISTLVHGELVPCLVSLVIMVGLVAMLIHWARLQTWTTGLSPIWLPATIFLLLSAIIFSPYVEQHRWPFAWVISKWSPAQNLGSDPPWITVALREYEQARLIAPNSNPRILEYLSSVPGGENLNDKVDWASAFAEWTLNQVGISGPKSLAAKAWVRWGRGVKEPQKGALAIFNFDGTEHVGFVLADAGDDLIVLGGNEEQKVQARRYPKSKLITYRMPLLPNENGNTN
jgi:uncharacterized protein (TIGR02594 family)